MSFFVKNVKQKATKLNNLKRKSTNDSTGKKFTKEMKLKRSKLDDIDDEEIPSDSEDEILEYYLGLFKNY
jgi:hypothetical protein